MAERIDPHTLNGLLNGDDQFALIDVRESGEYNSSHIPGASLIPRRRIEYIIESSVPAKSVHIVVCDDDGQRAPFAAATLERLGYPHVSILDGGVNRWSSLEYPTEWGVNVPSKDFGEKMEVVHHVPEISADELHQRIERGDKLVILDTRTPEEYQRFCIPGGRSMPGGELALRITDITKEIDEDTTVVINCAGRTRSIMGDPGAPTNGRPGFGPQKRHFGLAAGRLPTGRAAPTGWNCPRCPCRGPRRRQCLCRAAWPMKTGSATWTPPALERLMDRRDAEPVYLIDVRTEEEYREGHIPGFSWWPGGQAAQRADDLAVVKNAAIVFCCDD